MKGKTFFKKIAIALLGGIILTSCMKNEKRSEMGYDEYITIETTSESTTETDSTFDGTEKILREIDIAMGSSDSDSYSSDLYNNDLYSGSSYNSGSYKGRSTDSSSYKSNSYKAYDDGYDDVYMDGDYDYERYAHDWDYADGVDDAMDEFEEEW